MGRSLSQAGKMKEKIDLFFSAVNQLDSLIMAQKSGESCILPQSILDDWEKEFIKF
jgi:hypothetical protein